MNHVVFVQGAGDGAFEADSLLVASLRDALGPDYEVGYPAMPTDDTAGFPDWTARIDAALPPAGAEVALVGHSVGGSVLLKRLCETPLSASVTGLYVIAAPFWGADAFWAWDEATLPEDAAAKLAALPRIVLYHSRDDEVVPFSHLALLAARLPQAVLRPLDSGGHQLAGDLTIVARDIEAEERGSRRTEPHRR